MSIRIYLRNGLLPYVDPSYGIYRFREIDRIGHCGTNSSVIVPNIVQQKSNMTNSLFLPYLYYVQTFLQHEYNMELDVQRRLVLNKTISFLQICLICLNFLPNLSNSLNFVKIKSPLNIPKFNI